MSAVIQTYRNGTCGICMEDFVSGEPQYTHVGGENHDGFHRQCFVGLLHNRPVCPYDEKLIDPGTLLTTRTGWIRQAIEIAAYATAIGLAGAGAAVGVGTLAGLGTRIPALDLTVLGTVGAYEAGLVALREVRPEVGTVAAAVEVLVGIGAGTGAVTGITAVAGTIAMLACIGAAAAGGTVGVVRRWLFARAAHE